MATFDPRAVVAAKRDGRTLSAEEMRSLVLGYARGEIPDYLAAAFLMACFIRGLSDQETLFMTRAMVESGTVIGLEGVTRPIVDKHSTGGVSDGVTLVFAPLAASLGLAVAKLSGRGLAHTGGTLDKLESIPGLRTDLSPEELRHQVEAVGCAVAAQSKDVVPADGALYALRDATATVPSIPLIAASVMCKKLAVESDLVVLDVKTGSGAFMKTLPSADDLAAACVRLASAWGREAHIAVTDMSQPLGAAIGNALEIAEAVRVLRGDEGGRLRALAVELVADAMAGLLGQDPQAARTGAERQLDSGAAVETFARMVEAQGGDPKVADDPEAILPQAPVVTEVAAGQEGYVAAIEAEEFGMAASHLGAGRLRKGDPIDPAVGIEFFPGIGDRLSVGEVVARIHARDPSTAAQAGERVLATITLSEEPAEPPPLLYRWHRTSQPGEAERP